MPAEVKRVHPGIYLLFLGETVTEDEVADRMQRYQRAAESDGSRRSALVVDCVEVANPLQAARYVAKYLDTRTIYVMVVNGSFAGGILAERLSQKLTNIQIEGMALQDQAIGRVKTVMGVVDEAENGLVCDYL